MGKHLLHKHEDPCSNPQNPCKKLGAVVSNCNPRTGTGMGRGCYWDLQVNQSSQNLGVSKACERHWFERIRWGEVEQDT